MPVSSDSRTLRLPEIGYLILVGIAGWWLPGAGHWVVGKPKRAAIIFVSLSLAFFIGIWIGSIAAIDAKTPWYWAQLLNSPAVAYLSHVSSVFGYESYGRAREMGEIYTGIAGMLNLLCVVNAVYIAHNKCINNND